jgi:hypothetical protein
MLFVMNKVPVEIAAVGSALVLYGLGIITLFEAFAGFADPAVLLIAGLFVVSEGLDSAGVTTWLGQALGARAGSSSRRLLLLLMLLAAAMTAVISVVVSEGRAPAAAILTPALADPTVGTARAVAGGRVDPAGDRSADPFQSSAIGRSIHSGEQGRLHATADFCMCPPTEAKCSFATPTKMEGLKRRCPFGSLGNRRSVWRCGSPREGKSCAGGRLETGVTPRACPWTSASQSH